MNKNMIKKLAGSLLALAVVLTSLHVTWAYFSDRELATGTGKVELNGESRIHEEVEDGNKHIVIENTGKTDLIVRVMVAYTGAKITFTDEGNNWIEVDGWWYYKKVLPVGESTTELFAEVTDLPGYEINVIVILESERAVYGDGNKIVPSQPDWKYIPD